MLIKCQLPPGDRIAARYCFRAKCTVVHSITGHIVGEFVSHGKTPSCSHDVFIASRLYTEDEQLECTDVEMTLFNECPVECVREVVYTVFPDPDDDDTP